MLTNQASPMLWALTVPITWDTVTDIAEAAKTSRRTHLVMHARTLAAVSNACRFGPLTKSTRLLEGALGICIITDVMYPDGIIAAETSH
jgi:hypothetical protein